MNPRSHKQSEHPLRPGRVRSPADIGSLARAYRRHAGLTLTEISESTTLGLRFLSEFERGKENASLGRCLQALQALGLEVLVVPREEAEHWLRDRARGARGKGSA